MLLGTVFKYNDFDQIQYYGNSCNVLYSYDWIVLFLYE